MIIIILIDGTGSIGYLSREVGFSAFRLPMNEPDLASSLYRKPGHLIRRLQQIAVAIFLEETAAHDVTPVQYATLMAVRAHPGIDQLRVAQAIGFDRTTIGGVVERLEKRGFLSRKPGERDRRTKQLHVTRAGRNLLDAMAGGVERAQQRMVEGLGKRDRIRFIAMLSKLVRINNDTSRVPVNAPN